MSRRKIIGIRIALFAAAAVFLFVGAARGEAGTVFTKAVNICLESGRVYQAKSPRCERGMDPR